MTITSAAPGHAPVQPPGNPSGPGLPWPLLKSIAAVTNAPLTSIADALRDALAPYLGSSALVIFTEDCTGRPQKKAGWDASFRGSRSMNWTASGLPLRAGIPGSGRQ